VVEMVFSSTVEYVARHAPCRLLVAIRPKRLNQAAAA
jgi:hypothetical protein